MADRSMTVAPSPSMVGSPSVGPAPVQAPQRGYIPFRIATLERAEIIGQTQFTMTTAEQVNEVTVEGTGYIYGFVIDVNCVTASNAATVAYQEDAPYSAASQIILKDVTGEIVNMDGFSLEMACRYGSWKVYNFESSSDTNIYSKTSGSGGTGGSFRFQLVIPVALNRRTLIGILGNQDRAQQYQLRINLAASTAVYSTSPTTLGTVTYTRTYESYAVPNMTNDLGIRNQVAPSHYGTIHFLTKTLSEASPLGGSTVTHYLRRLGNTCRFIILILRANGSRATAESNLPTNIQVKLGNQPVFNETVQYRRQLMYNRYGFDAPGGVLTYDWLHDFSEKAGAELGSDWLWTQNLVLAAFQNVYPSGFGSTNNSLTVVTSDMIVPAGVNLYA